MFDLLQIKIVGQRTTIIIRTVHTSAVSGFRSIFNALSMLFNAVMVLYFGDKLCKVFWFPDRKK